MTFYFAPVYIIVGQKSPPPPYNLVYLLLFERDLSLIHLGDPALIWNLAFHRERTVYELVRRERLRTVTATELFPHGALLTSNETKPCLKSFFQGYHFSRLFTPPVSTRRIFSQGQPDRAPSLSEWCPQEQCLVTKQGNPKTRKPETGNRNPETRIGNRNPNPEIKYYEWW